MPRVRSNQVVLDRPDVADLLYYQVDRRPGHAVNWAEHNDRVGILNGLCKLDPDDPESTSLWINALEHMGKNCPHLGWKMLYAIADFRAWQEGGYTHYNSYTADEYRRCHHIDLRELRVGV